MLHQPQLHRRGRSLVSDDDEFFRVAMCSVLSERNGFSEAIETSSFDEALDRLRNGGKFEIGLFDLNMVGMKNWPDLSALRREFPEMLVVVVSASRRREDILMALRIGAHGFIHKGLGVGELSRAVDLICNGQVYVPPFLPDDTSAPAADRVDEPPEPASETSAETLSPTDSQLKCTLRQREIIKLLVAGHSNKAMARALNLSEGTVKFHMSAVFRLLGVTSRVGAATRAIKLLAD